MATITRIPEKVSLVGNNIVLGINTTNHLSQTGQVARLTLDVTGEHVAGDYFSVTVNGDVTDNADETVRFDCVNDTGVYSGSNLPYPAYGSGTIEDYAAVIAEWMNRSAFLTKYFRIFQDSSDQSQIIIESKEKITADVTLESASAPISSIITQSGLKDIRKQSFYVNVRVDLFDIETDEWKVLSQKSYSPDINGDVEMDISKVLKAHLTKMEFSFPESSGSLLIERADYCKRYRAFVYEDDGGSLSEKIVTQDLYAMRGGLSFRQQAIYNSQGSSFWDKLNYNFNFLTYAETEKKVSMYQPVKLFFLNYSTASTLKLMAEFYQEGGGSVTYTMATVDSEQYEIYEAIVTAAKLADNIGESFISYDVWMADGGDTQISEVRSFTLDQQVRENERWFLFKNSLGAAEIMRALGRRSKTNEYEQSLARVRLDFDFTDRDREETTLERSERQTFQAQIGFKDDPQVIENYRDFLLSKRVWEVIGKQLVPVSIMSKSVEMPKDQEMPFSISFKYQRAFTDNYYSKEKVPDKYNFDYSSDYDRPHTQ